MDLIIALLNDHCIYESITYCFVFSLLRNLNFVTCPQDLLFTDNQLNGNSQIMHSLYLYPFWSIDLLLLICFIFRHIGHMTIHRQTYLLLIPLTYWTAKAIIQRINTRCYYAWNSVCNNLSFATVTQYLHKISYHPFASIFFLQRMEW